MTERFDIQFDGVKYFCVIDVPNERCIGRCDTINDAKGFLELYEMFIDLNNEKEQLKQSVLSWSNSYNKVYQENQQLKNLIQHTYQTERTELGRNVLKQLLNNIGETNE